MLVREEQPGIFEVWRGSAELPTALEFSKTDTELAELGLFRALPEDTTPPTPYHQPAGIRFRRDGDTVQAVALFQLMAGLADAKQIARAILSDEHARARDDALFNYVGDPQDVHAAFDARLALHRAAINRCLTVAHLVALASDWPTVAEIEDSLGGEP